jgi:hypoxanthine phosphoribosyltransferase
LSTIKNLTPYLEKSKIDARIQELSSRITADYKEKVPIFIGILNGSFIFISDLVRNVNLDLEIDFLKLSSYGDSKISSGEVKLLKDLNCTIEGRDIIVVEDIVDSGVSLQYIRNLVLQHNPSSLEFVTLLFKKGISNLDFDVKYIGFEITNEFVVGYGLDYAQKYRNLNGVYILNNIE